jgi:hypothetical protein
MPLANTLIFIGALVIVGSINVVLILKIVRRIVVVHGNDGLEGGIGYGTSCSQRL